MKEELNKFLSTEPNHRVLTALTHELLTKAVYEFCRNGRDLTHFVMSPSAMRDFESAFTSGFTFKILGRPIITAHADMEVDVAVYDGMELKLTIKVSNE